MLDIYHLRCNYEVNPIGIDDSNPLLAWHLRSDRRLAAQSAYRILVQEGNKTVWDSFKEPSNRPGAVYSGPALQSFQVLTWQVKVWDEADTEGPWSEQASWEMGILNHADWGAVKWIVPEEHKHSGGFNPCPYLRALFTFPAKPVLKVRGYASAHGVYELYVNGSITGDCLFAPGFTSYRKRIRYQVYDITDMLRIGDNIVGAVLGDGWFRGKAGPFGRRNTFGTDLAFLFCLRVEYEDGTAEWIHPENPWRACTGPILKSDMVEGEIYDARLEMPGWNETGFDDSSWNPAKEIEFPMDRLVAGAGPPVRRRERFSPQVLFTPNGETVLDMGQNFAGRVKIRVSGSAGSSVRLIHGETLDQNGNFTLSNLVMSRKKTFQEVCYILKGGAEEVYEPHFTFHGFRYVLVLVEGFSRDIREGDFEGIAVYSDFEDAGSFTCSDPDLQRLFNNITWSMKSNFLEIPTDCPQRERAGWTGDAQIFASTASYIGDISGFLTRWLDDVAADQRPDGAVPIIVPAINLGFLSGIAISAGWGDAVAIIPRVLYQFYGDERILERFYPAMKAWADYMISRSGKPHWSRRFSIRRLLRGTGDARWIWDRDFHFGEWLEPGENRTADVLVNLVFSRPSVATAYLSYTCGIVAATAEILGNKADARRYKEVREKSASAWTDEFSCKDGSRLRPDRQATYVRALAFDLLPEQKRKQAAARLAELVEKNGYHIGTGFLATASLCHELTRAGYPDIAYRLLMQKEAPSWLYEVEKGATTIWESWDVIKADGRIGFSSLNHYSPGAVGAWFFDTIAGLGSEGPGFQRLKLKPQPGGSLQSASAWHETPYGRSECGWEIVNGEIIISILIPPGVTASLTLPRGAAGTDISDTDIRTVQSRDQFSINRTGEDVVIKLGSGKYNFSCPCRTEK